MKGGFIVICGLMMILHLPVLIAPRDIGIRGDSTSEKGQMAYILGQPLAYAWVLICNLFRTLPSYVLGENSLGLLGHTGTMSFPWALYAGSLARYPHSRAAILWKTSVKNRSCGYLYSARNGSAGLDFDVHCIHQTG